MILNVQKMFSRVPPQVPLKIQFKVFIYIDLNSNLTVPLSPFNPSGDPVMYTLEDPDQEYIVCFSPGDRNLEISKLV